MSASEVVATIFDWLRIGIELVVKLVSDLVKRISNKNKILPGS